MPERFNKKKKKIETLDDAKPMVSKLQKRLEFVDNWLAEIDQYLDGNPQLKNDIANYVRPEIQTFIAEIPKEMKE